VIEQTSLEAFEKICTNGTVHGDELRVLRLITELGPITGRELEPMMGKPIHCFSGRITKLKARGLITVAGRTLVDGSSMNTYVAGGAGKMEAKEPNGAEKHGGTEFPRNGGENDGRT
jgi:hypothetical protein